MITFLTLYLLVGLVLAHILNEHETDDDVWAQRYIVLPFIGGILLALALVAVTIETIYQTWFSWQFSRRRRKAGF